MGEMPSFGSEAKWKAPRKTLEKPKVQTDEEVIEVTDEDIIKPGDEKEGETLFGLESEEDTSADKIKKVKSAPGMMPDFMSGSETALAGAGEMYDAQAKKFDAMDLVKLTAEANLKAYLEATLSNPAVLSRIIKEVDPDIEGFKRMMIQAMLPEMKKIMKSYKPGEGMRDAMLALDEQFQSKLSRLRRGTEQRDERKEQPLRRSNRP